MPFDWREYLDLALRLQGQRGKITEEASLRSSASRAYYASYCWAINYACNQLGFIPRRIKVDNHKYLREHLTRHNKIGTARRLARLRSWRNQCDYDDEVSNISSLATNAIRVARQVIAECS